MSHLPTVLASAEVQECISLEEACYLCPTRVGRVADDDARGDERASRGGWLGRRKSGTLWRLSAEQDRGRVGAVLQL